jgi:hypothetical protein
LYPSVLDIAGKQIIAMDAGKQEVGNRIFAVVRESV